MKVAFLFEKKCPSYDFIFQVLQSIPEQARLVLDTTVSAGFWDFLACCEALGLRRMDQMVQFLARLIHNQEGSFTRVVSDECMVEAVRGDTYAVILYSIRRSLALGLHESLMSVAGYRGLIEVLPHLATHRRIFGSCAPTIRCEKRSLFVLSSTAEDPEYNEDSDLVDEMIEWARTQFPLLGLVLVRKHVGLKGSLFDVDSDNTFELQSVIHQTADQWSEIAEHAIYKLSDFAPDVVAELSSALRGMGAPHMSESECGQIAISLRRSLELFAELLSAGNPGRLADARLSRPDRGERYKDLIWNYLCRHFGHNPFFRDQLWFEVEHVGNLLNKGVHEHWIMESIRPLALRTILIMDRLLFPVKAGVVQIRMGDDLFK